MIYYTEIQQGFDDIMKRYSSYTNMPNIFSTYYDFLLPTIRNLPLK